MQKQFKVLTNKKEFLPPLRLSGKCKYQKIASEKMITIPSWLNEKAEQAGINFSAILQSALIEKLGLNS